MLNTAPFVFGDLRGAIYDYPEAGDILPMHTHTEDNVHISIVARGSFKISGEQWEMIGKTGDVIDWRPYQAHEFIALEDNSRLINIVKKKLAD